MIENGYCWGCGEQLRKKAKTGPAPTRWCSEKCRKRRQHERRVLAQEAEERRRFDLIASLLDELAPMGLTDDCPARRKAAA